MQPRPIYQELATLLDAVNNCHKKGNTEWENKHADRIEGLVKAYMPSGSGFDSGTKLLFDKSTPNKLVFETAYHHMNDNGYYVKWTEHKVTVTPSLARGFDVVISGPDYNGWKEYAYEVFQNCLSEAVSK